MEVLATSGLSIVLGLLGDQSPSSYFSSRLPIKSDREFGSSLRGNILLRVCEIKSE